jgi:lipid-A-disaccharide synthase
MLVIFPFEVDFYRSHGVQAEYVGHPLADEPLPTITREQFAAEHGLDNSKTWIALLPGSRHKEVLLNLPGVLATAAQLNSSTVQFVLPVASSLEPVWIEELLKDTPITAILVRRARAALRHSRVGIVASGTATVEAALIGTPFVMIYRVSPLTYAIGRRFVKLSRFAMVNLIAGRDVVPEFVQQNFIPQKVAESVRGLMVDGPARDTMIQDLAEIRGKLHSLDEKTAAERAADAILSTLAR